MKQSRFWIISLSLGLGLICTFWYCSSPKLFKTNGIDAISEDAAFIFCMKGGHNTVQALRETAFWGILRQNTSIASADKKFSILDSILSNNEVTKSTWEEEISYISIHPTKARDFDMLGVFQNKENISENNFTNWIEGLSDGSITVKTRVYENVKIHELFKNESGFAAVSLTNGLILLSSTAFLVEESIHQLKNGTSILRSKAFKEIRLDNKSENQLSLYINHFGLKGYLKSYFAKDYNSLLNAIGSFSRWDGFKVSISEMAVNFSGDAASLDTNDLIRSFRNQQTINSQLLRILSERTAFYLQYASDNLYLALQNMHSNSLYFDDSLSVNISKNVAAKVKQNEKDLMTDWLGNEMAIFITESGSIHLRNNANAILHVRDRELAMKSLEEVQKLYGTEAVSEKYKNYTLGRINSETIITKYYGKQFQMIRNPWYVFYEDFVIFSNQSSSLKQIIDDIGNKNVLSSTLSANEQDILTKAGNIKVYIDFTKGLNLMYAITQPSLKQSISQKMDVWNSFDSFYLNAGNTANKTSIDAELKFRKERKKTVSMMWSADLDVDIALGPELLKTESDSYSVLCQDKNDVIQFFDASGNLLWKKNIEESITSKIYIVDFYKNGGRQLFFSTQSKLYLLNLKGEDINRFPIRLPAKATCGASVIDLEDRQNFRIYVCTENSQIYAYELNGKAVSDWQSPSLSSTISHPITLVSIKGKNYLLLQNSNGYIIANSKGKIKTLDLKFSTSSSNILYTYRDDELSTVFCLKDSTGLFSVSIEGKVLKKWTTFPGTISSTLIIDQESKNINQAVLYNDSLVIYDSNGQLKYNLKKQNFSNYNWTNFSDSEMNDWTGLYSSNPDQFYLLGTKQVSASGFPVKGSGKFTLIENNSKSSIDFAVGSGSKSFYIYRIE